MSQLLYNLVSQKETVEFLAKKERPPQLSVDETIVYDFVTEINANKIVSDKTYNSLKSRFGEKGVVELTALIGYFYTPWAAA
ncbi:hypothetical protein ACFS3C_21300 [Azotobacter vinelandii]